MAKTLNLQLNLEENGETKFEIWRKSIDGNNLDSEKSNMQILDEVIGEIQKAISITNEDLNKYKFNVEESIKNTNDSIELVKKDYTSKVEFLTQLENKASKEYVDEKIEQIETVKGDKGDKGETGRGIASITMENGNFIVHYTDGTRQEIVNEQDYIYEFILVDGTYIENDYENAGGWGIKVEGTLPPAYSLIVTTDFFESLEVLSGIAVYGFANQSNLMEIEIHIPTISAYSFQECSNLTKVLIGQEVRNIGAYAFNLTSVGEQNGVLQFEGNSYLLKTKIWSSSSLSKLYIHRNAFDTDEIYFYCLGDNAYVKVYWDSNGNIDAINV